MGTLIAGVAVTRVIYAVGVAAAYGYTSKLGEGRSKSASISQICFPICKPFLCAFLTPGGNGDVMSYFTNDVDTISDAPETTALPW